MKVNAVYLLVETVILSYSATWTTWPLSKSWGSNEYVFVSFRREKVLDRPMKTCKSIFLLDLIIIGPIIYLRSYLSTLWFTGVFFYSDQPVLKFNLRRRAFWANLILRFFSQVLQHVSRRLFTKCKRRRSTRGLFSKHYSRWCAYRRTRANFWFFEGRDTEWSLMTIICHNGGRNRGFNLTFDLVRFILDVFVSHARPLWDVELHPCFINRWLL